MRDRNLSIALVTVILAATVSAACAYADFAGPSLASFASSPDGQLLVRIRGGGYDPKTDKPLPANVVYYEYDAKQDGYKVASQFELKEYPYANLMYLSNAGDLVLIALAEKESIKLYLKDGTLKKDWSLADFLKGEETKGCAQTGSTLQWLEEGSFSGRTFLFRGPSRVIRALSPSFTVMRGVDEKVSFSAMIEVESGALRRTDQWKKEPGK